jgi:hypothetical protein
MVDSLTQFVEDATVEIDNNFDARIVYSFERRTFCLKLAILMAGLLVQCSSHCKGAIPGSQERSLINQRFCLRGLWSARHKKT